MCVNEFKLTRECVRSWASLRRVYACEVASELCLALAVKNLLFVFEVSVSLYSAQGYSHNILEAP